MADSKERKPVDALGIDIKLGIGISIDAYLMPTGVVRYGIAYLSKLLGYGEKYFLRVTKTESRKLGGLIYKGYTGDLISVKVLRESSRGATFPQTLSFDDFCILVEHEAIEEENPKAIALLTASFREVLRGRTQEALGLSEDTLERKQSDFTDYINWYESDREDIENLALPGDEPHLQSGLWNESFRDAS